MMGSGAPRRRRSRGSKNKPEKQRHLRQLAKNVRTYMPSFSFFLNPVRFWAFLGSRQGTAFLSGSAGHGGEGPWKPELARPTRNKKWDISGGRLVVRQAAGDNK
jgi:hypothetical protein